MNKRVLVLAVTHTVLAAGMFAWGWRVAQGRAVAAAAGNSAPDAGPVKPAKLGVAAQKKTEVGKEAVLGPGPEDPVAFVAWAKELADRSGDPFGESAACRQLRALFHRDRERALRIALLARQEKLTVLFDAFATEWGKSDLGGAVEWAKSLGGGAQAETFWLLKGVIAPENASEAVRLLLPELVGDLRDKTLQSILSVWSASDPSLCFAWVQSLPVSDIMRLINFKGGPFWGNGFSNLVEGSPKEVAAFVRALPGNEHSLRLMESTAGDLALIDPSMALGWANSLESSGARVSCLNTVWSMWARNDLAAATMRALAQTDPQARHRAIEAIAEVSLNVSHEEDRKWIEALPPDVRLIAEGQAIEWMAGPEAAKRVTQLLAGADATAEPVPEIARSAGSSFASSNPSRAAEWVQSLAPGKVQMQAAAGVAAGWAQHDPVAASEWTASLPVGDARDGAAASLAGELVRSDPEAAFSWAESVGSAVERAEALRATVHEWKAIDPTAARRTIEASGLAPAEKTALLGQLGRE